MIRLFTIVGYLLVALGMVAVLAGLLTLELTPLVLGGILSGLGGVLLLLVRLERRLNAALPALDSLAQTAGFLARKESFRAPPVPAAGVEPQREPASVRVRHGAPGAVDVYPESGD